MEKLPAPSSGCSISPAPTGHPSISSHTSNTVPITSEKTLFDNSAHHSHNLDEALPSPDNPLPLFHNQSHISVSASVRSGVVEDARSLESISLPPSAQELAPKTKVYPPFSFEVVALLMSTSVFGVLARLGIRALASYEDAAIFPLAWVQATGCFIMGIGFSLKGPIGNFYGPAYTAVTTGFCGSLTTFSSWQIDVFEGWSTSDGLHRSWLRHAIDGLSRSCFTMAASLSSLALGLHIGTSLRPYVSHLQPAKLPFRIFATSFSVLIYALTIPFYVRLNHAWRPEVTAALLFSFPGTFTRYCLSWSLNPRMKSFPLGTFTANIVATALLATFHVLQATTPGGREIPCGILQGLVDGYCGCLSTVSTFAVEVRELKGRKAWIYVAISWLAGQACCLIILGPSWWHAGLNANPICPPT